MHDFPEDNEESLTRGVNCLKTLEKLQLIHSSSPTYTRGCLVGQ